MDTKVLLDEIRKLDRKSLPNEDVRAEVLRAAQALCSRLETPFEWVMRRTWQEPTLNFCLIVADDIRLFEKLGQDTGTPRTRDELAVSTSTDPALLGRLLRHLAAKGVISEYIGREDSYCATELSGTLATLEGSSGIRHVSQVYTPMHQHVPAYFKATGYREVKDNRNGAFQNTIGKPGQSYFEWIQQPENKNVATDFNLLMKFTTRFRKSWMDVFSPNHILLGVKSSSDSLFVDIGGGIGTDASEFRHRYPHVHGKVFLQELPAVIDSALENHGEVFSRGVEPQKHDFFAPQPVHGARIYFMGSVLHDWPDDEARNILRNVVPAMAKGYSKLLLSENVIPPTGCHPHLSALDLTMMTLFGSQERTEGHWRRLLESEGLKLVAVHTIPSCLKSVLEAELA